MIPQHMSFALDLNPCIMVQFCNQLSVAMDTLNLCHLLLVMCCVYPQVKLCSKCSYSGKCQPVVY